MNVIRYVYVNVIYSNLMMYAYVPHIYIDLYESESSEI